jgi:hypothetical protein
MKIVVSLKFIVTFKTELDAKVVVDILTSCTNVCFNCHPYNALLHHVNREGKLLCIFAGQGRN